MCVWSVILLYLFTTQVPQPEQVISNILEIIIIELIIEIPE